MRPTTVFAAIAIGVVPLQSALDERLTTTEHFMYAAPGDLTMPSDAAETGFLSRVARVASVPFGFEADESSPRPALSRTVEAHSISAATLREALDAFVRLDPRYQWRDLQGVFVVRTVAAWKDPANALNQPVRDINWRDLTVLAAYDRIAQLLYPHGGELYSGFKVKGDRLFSVNVTRGTIVDVLNAAARADGELGWSVRYGGPSDSMKFELAIGHYGNGPTHRWTERPTPSGR
jgi:hypothetical protein